MLRIAVYLLAALIALTAGLSVGCKKKPGGAGQVSGAIDPSKLAGSAEVFAALDKKQYDTALAALVKVNQNLSTDEQKAEYLVLTRKVKDRLLDDAATDPKAMDALSALRGMGMGR